MNILITSAARRIDFVRFFQEAYKKLDIRGEVIAADPEYNAPSLQQAEISYVIPKHTAPDYADEIMEICRRHDVRGIIPVNDLEISKLAENKEKFSQSGISVFASSPEIVEIIRDKGKYEEFLGNFGVQVPRTFIELEEAKEAVQRGEASLPFIIKPRNGQASIGIHFARSLDELETAYTFAVNEIKEEAIAETAHQKPEDNVIFQETVEGEKFSLDVFNDLNGRYLTTFVRKQLAMRGGDVDRCLTVNEPALMEIGRKIGENLGHTGYINTDVYYDGTGYYVIDMNPRIGGGYSFSHEAGADIPSVILALLSGGEVKEEWLTEENDLEFARHDVVAQINKNKAKKVEKSL